MMVEIQLNNDEIKLTKDEVIGLLSEIYDCSIPWANKVTVIEIVQRYLGGSRQ